MSSITLQIIPAPENLRKAVKSIKRGERIVIEGFLANLNGTYERQPVWWNTSASAAIPEIIAANFFYIKKVRTGDEVYQ